MTSAELATMLSLFEGVLAEVPQAMAAYQQLRAMAAAGVDPSPEQWAALDGAVDAVHAQLQQGG